MIVLFEQAETEQYAEQAWCWHFRNDPEWRTANLYDPDHETDKKISRFIWRCNGAAELVIRNTVTNDWAIRILDSVRHKQLLLASSLEVCKDCRITTVDLFISVRRYGNSPGSLERWLSCDIQKADDICMLIVDILQRGERSRLYGEDGVAFCNLCGSRVFMIPRGIMLPTSEHELDYYYYCTNKACSFHEGVWLDDMDAGNNIPALRSPSLSA